MDVSKNAHNSWTTRYMFKFCILRPLTLSMHWYAGAYFFLKNRATSQQIGTSIYFLPVCYSPQESMSGKIKIKPLLPSTRCQWSVLYPHQHFFTSENTLNPPQFVWKLKVTFTSPITHFQFVDQYYTIFKIKGDTSINNWAVTRDFQQFGILTSVDSDEPMQPHFKLRISK